jgi:hypothetical protein
VDLDALAQALGPERVARIDRLDLRTVGGLDDPQAADGRRAGSTRSDPATSTRSRRAASQATCASRKRSRVARRSARSWKRTA